MRKKANASRGIPSHFNGVTVSLIHSIFTKVKSNESSASCSRKKNVLCEYNNVLHNKRGGGEMESPGTAQNARGSSFISNLIIKQIR